jgi:hypothetical protein
VDTNLFMDKIRSRMEQQLLKGTINQHMHGVTGTELDSDDPTPRILHVNYTVKDPTTTGEKRTFSIPHLTNCFSEDFFKELVARINTLPFQNGVGGKQQCYVQFVCNDPDCPMVIGHKHPHKCVKFTPTDELVMSVYNVLRMWKDQAITKETKADHKITDQCNMIQYIVGQISKGNYGAHSDACPLLNANGTELEDDISIGMDASFLPTINEEQTTYTIVLTNSTFPTDTSFTHFTEGGKKLGKLIKLTGNSIHIQWPGSQADPVEHSTTWLHKDRQSTYRIIISGRTVCPSTHPSFESKLLASVDDNVNILDRSTWHNNYVVTNVIDKIMSPTVIPAVVANPNAAKEEGVDGTTEPTPKQQKAANSMAPDGINLNYPAYSNRFPKISLKEYDQLGIVHLLPTGELDITRMWEAIQDPSLVKELFLEGYLPKMEVTEGTEGMAPDVQELIPRLVEHVPYSKNNPCRAPRTRKRFLCPGKYMKLTAAEQLAGIKSSDQSHPPVCHLSDPQISCLLLLQPYKNNLNLIKKTAEHFRLR